MRYKQSMVVKELGADFFKMSINDRAEYLEEFFDARELCFEDYCDETGLSNIMTYSQLFELFEKEEVTSFEIVAKMMCCDRMVLAHSIRFKDYPPIKIFKLEMV